MHEDRTEDVEYLPPYEAMKAYEKYLIDTFNDFLRTPKGKHILKLVHDMRKAGKTPDEIDIAVRREETGREAPEMSR